MMVKIISMKHLSSFLIPTLQHFVLTFQTSLNIKQKYVDALTGSPTLLGILTMFFVDEINTYVQSNKETPPDYVDTKQKQISLAVSPL